MARPKTSKTGKAAKASKRASTTPEAPRNVLRPGKQTYATPALYQSMMEQGREPAHFHELGAVIDTTGTCVRRILVAGSPASEAFDACTCFDPIHGGGIFIGGVCSNCGLRLAHVDLAADTERNTPKEKAGPRLDGWNTPLSNGYTLNQLAASMYLDGIPVPLIAAKLSELSDRTIGTANTRTHIYNLKNANQLKELAKAIKPSQE